MLLTMLMALAMLPLGTMVTLLSPVITISSSSESDSDIIRLEVCASEGKFIYVKYETFFDSPNFEELKDN